MYVLNELVVLKKKRGQKVHSDFLFCFYRVWEKILNYVYLILYHRLFQCGKELCKFFHLPNPIL